MSSLLFFPSPVSPGLDLKAPETWKCTLHVNRKNSKRGSLWSEAQERNLLRAREGGRNSSLFVFSFSPFSSTPAPRQYYTGGSSGPVVTVAAGQAPETEGRGPFSLQQWSCDHRKLEQIPLPFLLSTLLLSSGCRCSQCGRVWYLKLRNARLVRYLKINQCNPPYLKEKLSDRIS